MKRKSLTKFLALSLAVVMTVMTAACGSSDDESSSASSSDSTEESSEESTESTDEASSDETEEEETYDLGGVTLTVLNQSDIAGLNPDAEGLEDYQIAERQEAKDYIEQKYNVVLEFVDLPTGDWDDEAAEIVSAYASGNPVADIMDAYFQFAGTYIANGILYDFTDDFASSDVFNESYYFEWTSAYWGLCSGIGGEGIYYNKTWIEEMGMEYTPAEMFDMGLWSYDDCYDYMLEMKSYLAEDEYPLFVSPYYWMLFATAANGEIILDPSGNLNYCSDAFLESLEFFAKCLEDGLIAYAPTTESGGYDTWSYPGSTFDAGNTLVMAHRASWQAASISAGFELGFVPYPWGSNVTIGSTGSSGDYLTLSDNYAASYYDGQLICLTDGIQDKADPMIVLQLVAEWMGWDGAFSDYDSSQSTASCGWLEDGIDKELYFYSLSIERLEPFNSLDIDLTLAPNGTLYGGASIRSSMESFYNQDMATMIDAGYASEDVYTPYDVDE